MNTIPRSGFALLGALGISVFPAAAATVIGNSTVSRSSLDAFSGQIFLLNADTSPVAGQQVVSWAIFNNQVAGRSVTPVIAEDTSGNQTSFTIRGIGQTRTTDGGGVQSFLLALAGGTDVIGANYYLGVFDGAFDFGTGAASPGPGSAEFNGTNDPPVAGQIDSTGTIWLNTSGGGNTPANMGVGAVNPQVIAFGVDGRHYSVQFSTGVIPEPGSALLLGFAAFPLRRRRAGAMPS